MAAGASAFLTDEEVAAVTGYAASAHRRLNACLRGEEAIDDEIKAVIALLDRAIAKSGVSGDLQLYRGVDGDVASWLAPSLRAGVTLRDDAYMSTSASIGGASIFSSWPPGLIFRIRLPAGARALDMRRFSAYPDEHEFLLPRGTELRILGFDGARTIDADVVLNV